MQGIQYLTVYYVGVPRSLCVYLSAAFLTALVIFLTVVVDSTVEGRPELYIRVQPEKDSSTVHELTHSAER